MNILCEQHFKMAKQADLMVQLYNYTVTVSASFVVRMVLCLCGQSPLLFGLRAFGSHRSHTGIKFRHRPFEIVRHWTLERSASPIPTYLH